MEIGKTDILPKGEAYNYYLLQSRNLLKKYGKRFDEFTRDQSELVQIGDEILKKSAATGYNILMAEQDMHLSSNDALIFYSNYIGRSQHFGILLSEMESTKIISRSKIGFGVKASKILYDKDWGTDQNDEQLEILGSGRQINNLADKTVEIVITFRPNSADHSIEIVDFLKRRASLQQPNCIPGSWYIPDIRATSRLKEALEKQNFEEVCVNRLLDNDAQMLVLRKKTGFLAPWINFPAEINTELATFLTNFGVKP